MTPTDNSEGIRGSELLLNPNGSIYHLYLRPEQVADRVIIVGDPGRVAAISANFDTVEHVVENREFVTHTGTFNGKRVTALSTGIGTDNIDIVLNELDALVNVNFETRMPNDTKRSLSIIRIGTTGALQGNIPVNSFIVSAYGLGMDGLLHHYKNDICETAIENAFLQQVQLSDHLPRPYVVKGSQRLIDSIGADMYLGMTATAAGFYAPQGRMLRLPLANPHMVDQMTEFKFEGLKVTNFEMETSAFYGLGQLLGHDCCTVCVAIANRVNQTYNEHYKEYVAQLISLVLKRLTS